MSKAKPNVTPLAIPWKDILSTKKHVDVSIQVTAFFLITIANKDPEQAQF